VANSGVITALDGDASQYVRGDGTLADFPTSTGGGSSVSYYLNSSVSQGTIGGVAYRQLGKTPIAGAGTDIAISTTGYIASYITDANDPALLEVPAGNFNCEFYFSVNNNTGNPFVYAEVYKYDGTTFTLIGTSVGVPEYINQGTVINPYYFAVPVAQSVLTVTDRIAIRIYVNVDGRVVTLHTENNHLCQVVTTFSKGLTSLNNLTRQVQFLATGTSGTDFGIVSSVATHTFNLPVASATNTGKLSSTDWSTFNGKVPYTGATANVDLGNFNFDANEISGGAIIAKLNGPASSPFILKSGSSGYVIGDDAISLISSPNVANTLILASNIGVVTKTALIGLGSLTANRTFILPDASGTLALTSNLSSYVPYTGATADVNLGVNFLIANAAKFDGSGSFGGHIALKQNGTAAAYTGYATLSSIGVNKLNIYYGESAAYATELDNSLLTQSRLYKFPDLSGTLALLEGTQTFSGAKTFSGGATFTTAINVNRQINISKTPSLVAYTGGYITNYGTSNGIIYADGDTGNLTTFIYNFGGNYNYTFPTASGTIALTSNLSAYVPYTGATQAVNLGAFDLTVNGLTVGRGGSSVSSNTVLGTTALNSNTTGSENTALGWNSLQNNTTGVGNTGVGAGSLYLNTTGSSNTALGYATLTANTTGTQNVAIGVGSLQNNTTASYNVAIGTAALSANTTGGNNTAIGFYALRLNTTGGNNTAIGVNALQNNTTAIFNTAIGSNSLNANTTGASNTAIGSESLIANTTGSSNVAIGSISLSANTIGSQNTAIGNSSLAQNTTGVGNTSIGFASLSVNTSGNYNVSLGGGNGNAITTGSSNILIGYNTGNGITTGSNNTIIGGGVFGLSATLANNIILADGAGNIRYQWNGTNNVFGNPISGTSATFSGDISTTGGSVTIGTGGNYVAGSIYSDSGWGMLFRAKQASPTNAQFRWSNSTDATEFMRISNSGGLLVGTTPDGGFKLDIGGTSRFTGAATFSSSVTAKTSFTSAGTNASPVFEDWLSSNPNGSSTLTKIQIGNSFASSAGTWMKFSVNSNTAVNTPVDVMTLKYDGNVGIGTSSPTPLTATALVTQINSSNTFSELRLTNSSTSNGAILAQYGLDSYVSNIANGFMVFGTNNTERMRILSGGSVAIGDSGDANVRFQIKSVGTGSTTYATIMRNSAGTDSFWIRDDGAGYLRAAAWSYGSDKRIKENINYIETGLDKVLALKPATFDYIDGVKNNVGWIAQDVQEVIPEAIGTISETNDQLTLKSDFIVPYLVKAIQEQQQQIEELKELIKNK
jgi:hypothetical protein